MVNKSTMALSVLGGLIAPLIVWAYGEFVKMQLMLNDSKKTALLH